MGNRHLQCLIFLFLSRNKMSLSERNELYCSLSAICRRRIFTKIVHIFLLVLSALCLGWCKIRDWFFPPQLLWNLKGVKLYLVTFQMWFGSWVITFFLLMKVTLFSATQTDRLQRFLLPSWSFNLPPVAFFINTTLVISGSLWSDPALQILFWAHKQLTINDLFTFSYSPADPRTSL